jgi:glycosyltransferase involved in cell wall biosynthesis
MRILMIVSEIPPIESGVARCADQMARGLRSRGHHVDIVSTLDVRRWSLGEFRITAFPAYWRRLAPRLRSYDVVNVHGPVPTMSDAFLALARFLPARVRPAIVYTHHSEIELPGLRWACSLYNRAHRRLARIADRVVTSTPSYAGSMSAPGGPPVDVIPWGVDVDRFGPRPDAAHPAGNPLRALFVGQMRPYKGLGNLLMAVAGDSRIHLTVVGSGPLEAAYREQAQALGAHNVEFLGRVPDDELSRLYLESGCIVLPSVSRGEAFGLVLLEGMAAGCVPVASDLPGVRDVAGPTGVLVPPGEVPALRRALVELAMDPARARRLGRESQGRAVDMGWGRVTESYERVFRRAVLDSGRRAVLPLLPVGWRPPEYTLTSVGERFGASWTSLLFFDGTPGVRAAWGRIDLEAIRREPPRIAEYVARTGQPLVIDKEMAPPAIRDWLTRDDVSSGLSVPVRCPAGTLVLNLSLAQGSGRRYTTADLDSLLRSVPRSGPNGNGAAA